MRTLSGMECAHSAFGPKLRTFASGRLVRKVYMRTKRNVMGNLDLLEVEFRARYYAADCCIINGSALGNGGTMSEKPSPRRSARIPAGALGLAFAILFCIEIAASPARLSSVALGGVLGLASLVISLLGVAKGSGRVAGACGIFVFLLGCLMMFSVVLDIIASHSATPG